MVKKCKSCKYWRIEDNYTEFRPFVEIGHCSRFNDVNTIIDDAGIDTYLEFDDEVKFTKQVKKAVKKEPLILSGYYGSSFMTQPHFYCSEWQSTNKEI